MLSFADISWKFCVAMIRRNKKSPKDIKHPFHSLQHKDQFWHRDKGQDNIICFQEGMKALHRGRDCFWEMLSARLHCSLGIFCVEWEVRPWSLWGCGVIGQPEHIAGTQGERQSQNELMWTRCPNNSLLKEVRGTGICLKQHFPNSWHPSRHLLFHNFNLFSYQKQNHHKSQTLQILLRGNNYLSVLPWLLNWRFSCSSELELRTNWEGGWVMITLWFNSSSGLGPVKVMMEGWEIQTGSQRTPTDQIRQPGRAKLYININYYRCSTCYQLLYWI